MRARHSAHLWAVTTIISLGTLAGVGHEALAQELRAAIYVMKADGSQLRKVVQVDGYKEFSSPVWSHDGTRLAFDALSLTSGTKKIFVVNVDGSQLQEVCDGETPDWSPDDKQIAWHYSGGKNLKAGVCVQNLDGKGRVHVADGAGPRWSPDGAKLAYTNGHNVVVLDLITGDERGLISEPIMQVSPGFDWSPDGKRLAVVVRLDRRRKELWLVDTQGPSPKWKSRLRLTLDQRVAWSPDGKRIVISASRRLMLLDPDGKSTYRLPDQHGDSVEPDWSPDGKWLAFSGNHPDG